VRPGIYHLGPDPGFRPGTRHYQFGPTLIVGGVNSPFPPNVPRPGPIHHYQPPVSHRVGPIPGAGHSREGLRPIGGGHSGDPSVGMRANQAALERARAADAARAETARQAAERARAEAARQAERGRQSARDEARRSAERSRQVADQLQRDRNRRFAEDAARRHREFVSPVAGRRPGQLPQRGATELVPPRRATTSLVPTWGGLNGIPSKVPESPKLAPPILEVPQAVLFQLSDLRDRTLATGQSPAARSEYGQLIAVDGEGHVALMGPPILGGKDGVDMSAHREILKKSDVKGVALSDDRFTIIGIAHTHPVTNNFSGGDIANFANDRSDRVKLVVGEKAVFMLLRTAETDSEPIFRQAPTWDKKVATRIGELERGGTPRDAAHAIAVNETAQTLGMALYVYDRGTFRKVK